MTSLPLSRLKFHFEITLGKMLRPERRSPQDVKRPYLRAANVLDGEFDLNDVKLMWFSPWEVGRYELRPGDLLVLEGGDVGRAAIWNGEISDIGFQNSVHRLRARPGNCVRFAFYWFQYLKSSGYFNMISSQATLAHYTAEKVKETPFPNLDFSTQRRIADFLDRETARIDELISKNHKVLKKLWEKQNAIITEHVFQGNRHGGPRLKHFVDINPSPKSISHLPGDSPVSFVPMEALQNGIGGVDLSERRALKDVMGGSYTFFGNGDVLLAKVTPCFENGKKAVVENLPFGIGFATSEVHVIRPRPNLVDPHYLKYLFSSHPFKSLGISNMTGASGLRRVPAETILNFRLPVSKVEEQRKIAAFLNEKVERYQQLMRRIRELIDTLRDLRSSLIHDAVMGEVDATTTRLDEFRPV